MRPKKSPWELNLPYKSLYVLFANISFMMALLLQGCVPAPVTLAQSSAEIIFVSNRDVTFDLYLLDAQTKQVTPLKNSNPFSSRGIAPAWSPDGMILAFAGGLTKEDGTSLDRTHPWYGLVGITLLDANSKRVPFGPSWTAPAWSPDGTMLAFYPESCNETLELKVASVNDGKVKTVAGGIVCPYGDLVQSIRISWSPDGKYLVVDAPDEFAAWHIWLVESQGGTPKKLRAGRHPAWSPVDNRIAFDRDKDIWLMSIDGKNEVQLVDYTALDEWPTWSPDAQQIAFVSYRDGNAEIYRVNLDGTGVERLTDHPEFDGFPSWRPNFELNK